MTESLPVKLHASIAKPHPFGRLRRDAITAETFGALARGFWPNNTAAELAARARTSVSCAEHALYRQRKWCAQLIAAVLIELLLELLAQRAYRVMLPTNREAIHGTKKR